MANGGIIPYVCGCLTFAVFLLIAALTVSSITLANQGKLGNQLDEISLGAGAGGSGDQIVAAPEDLGYVDSILSSLSSLASSVSSSEHKISKLESMAPSQYNKIIKSVQVLQNMMNLNDEVIDAGNHDDEDDDSDSDSDPFCGATHEWHG